MNRWFQSEPSLEIIQLSVRTLSQNQIEKVISAISSALPDIQNWQTEENNETIMIWRKHEFDDLENDNVF